MPRLGATTVEHIFDLEYIWAHVVKVHTVPPCEVRRGAPAPSPAVRAEGPHLPAPSPWVEPSKGSTPAPTDRECRGRSAPAVEVRALSVVWLPTRSRLAQLAHRRHTDRERNSLTRSPHTPTAAHARIHTSKVTCSVDGCVDDAV